MIKAILRAISALTGHDEDLKSEDGSLMVKISGSNAGTGILVSTTGASGPANDRRLAVTTDFVVGTRYREDYGVDANGNKLGPKLLIVTVIGGTADSKFLFDEPDTGVANAMLAVTPGGGIVLLYKIVTPGIEIERRIFTFDSRIRYVDFIAGTGATAVELLGV